MLIGIRKGAARATRTLWLHICSDLSSIDCLGYFDTFFDDFIAERDRQPTTTTTPAALPTPRKCDRLTGTRSQSCGHFQEHFYHRCKKNVQIKIKNVKNVTKITNVCKRNKKTLGYLFIVLFNSTPDTQEMAFKATRIVETVVVLD